VTSYLDLRTRVVFGTGALARLGEMAHEHGFHKTLLVTDRGIMSAGHAERASGFLRRAGIEVVVWSGFSENPDSTMIAAGAEIARAQGIDSLVGMGGGSSMDAAKGVAFLLSNGGAVRDYWGYGKARNALPPMIGIPTTAGTGSEAQSYALLSDPATHTKMAVGDRTASFRTAILDPELTVTQPPKITAFAGYDAISHCVETFVTTKRTAFSESFSREGWRLVEPNFERVLGAPSDLEARGAMLLGAHYAGIAIENSMLGAAHACANPLTARYDASHGLAIALMLPHVVRWNASHADERYSELLRLAGRSVADGPGGAAVLAARLEDLAVLANLPRSLRAIGVTEADLPALAEDAAQQWTGQFNPRPFDAAGALELYRVALG
jgi:alcohol dehydrogenase